MKPKPGELLEAARQEAVKVAAWADLSNFLFNPDDGLITMAYPVGPDRTKFMKSDEYKAIREVIREVQNRTGFHEGMTPKKSGKFVVRLPQTLHAALELEAAREGVSLNQLVVAKLSLQMGVMLAERSHAAVLAD